MPTFHLRIGCLAAFATLCVFNQAQAGQQDNPLNGAVKVVRTQRLMPLSTPPPFDWERIKSAYAFEKAHDQSIQTTLLTAAPVSTFASLDTMAVLLYDGKLLNDYNRQMKITVEWIDEIIATPKQKADFTRKNYKRAVDFGLMNLDFSQTIKLKWNPKVRVPGNQQAFGLVLYSFSWLPIEKMIATHEIDPVKDAKAINDWLYLWHVLGYGMGEDARLLPQNADQAAEVMRLLRANQYPGPHDEIPYQLRALLRNEMTFLYAVYGQGVPIDDPTKLEIRKNLAAEISYSPGLSKALGLSDDPAKSLTDIARSID
jgi:hypothetical protein